MAELKSLIVNGITRLNNLAYAMDIYANAFKTTGGTSSHFVKGDGSLDSSTYALSASLGNYLPLTGGTLSGQLTSTVTNVAPFVVASSTLVTNLNADKLDGHDSTYFATADGYVKLDAGAKEQTISSSATLSNGIIELWRIGTNVNPYIGFSTGVGDAKAKLGYIGFLGENSPVMRNSANNANFPILHSGNSSISKDGSTLTIKINGTSYTCPTTDTNTWRNIYVSGAEKITSANDTKAINYIAGDGLSVAYVAAGEGSELSGSNNYFNIKYTNTGVRTLAISNLQLLINGNGIDIDAKTLSGKSDSAYVHRAEDETITGNKTFNADVILKTGKYIYADASGTGMSLMHYATEVDSNQNTTGLNSFGAWGSNSSYHIKTVIRSTKDNLYHRRGISSTYTDYLIADAANIVNENPTLSWGSTSTVATIAGVSVQVTMPDSPNTDTKVTQALSTTTDYRPITLGKNSSATCDNASLYNTITELVYTTNKLSFSPSYGALYVSGFMGIGCTPPTNTYRIKVNGSGQFTGNVKATGDVVIGNSTLTSTADSAITLNLPSSGGTLALLSDMTSVLKYKDSLPIGSSEYTPAADVGDTYIVSASGATINGVTYEAGDMFICKATTVAATSSNVDDIKGNWNVVQTNFNLSDYVTNTSLSNTLEDYVTKINLSDTLNEYDKGPKVYVMTCNTAANASVKVCKLTNTTDDGTFSVRKGVMIAVLFDLTNTASNLKLQIKKLNDSTIGGEIAIHYGNTRPCTVSSTRAGGVKDVYTYYVYDGTYWVFSGASNDLNDAVYQVTTSTENYRAILLSNSSNASINNVEDSTGPSYYTRNLYVLPSTGNLYTNGLLILGTNIKFAKMTDNTGYAIVSCETGGSNNNVYVSNILGAFGNGTTENIKTILRTAGTGDLIHRVGKKNTNNVFTTNDYVIADSGNITNDNINIECDLETTIATIAGKPIKVNIHDNKSIKKDSNTNITYVANSYIANNGTSIGGVTSSLTWKYVILNVEKGDRFLIKGLGGSNNARLYAFSDVNDVLNDNYRAAASLNWTTYHEIVAPYDGKLVVNFNTTLANDLIPISWVSGFLNRSNINPVLASSGNNINVTVGDVTSNNLTVPFATNSTNASYATDAFPNAYTSLGIKTAVQDFSSLALGTTYQITGSATDKARIPTRWFIKLSDGLTVPYNGMIIKFKLPGAGLGTVGEAISLDGGELNLHQVVYSNNSFLTTHFGGGSTITVLYDSGVAASMYGKYDSSQGKYVHNSNTQTAVYGVWRVMNLYDSGNTDVRYLQQLRYLRKVVATGGMLCRTSLCMHTQDGKITSLTVTNNNTGTTKSMYTGYLDYRKVFYYAGGDSFNADAVVAMDGNLYTHFDLIDLRYTFNCGTTLTTRANFYIVGTVDANGFKLDPTTPWSCSLPNSEDGKIYIYVGTIYPDTSPYRCLLEENNTAYIYKNGGVRVYSGYSTYSNYAASAGTASTAGGVTGLALKTLTIAGTDYNIYTTSSNNLPAVIPLAGASTSNPITGALHFLNTDGIRLLSLESNSKIWEISSSESSTASWAEKNGFYLEYMDSSWYENGTPYLNLCAHSTGTYDTEIYRILQNGTIKFMQEPKYSDNTNTYYLLYATNKFGSANQILATNSSGNGLTWVTKPTSNVTTAAYVSSSDTGKAQITAAQSNPYYNLVEGSTVTRSIRFYAGTGMSISAATNGTITFTNTSTNVSTSAVLSSAADGTSNVTAVTNNPYYNLIEGTAVAKSVRFSAGTGIAVEANAAANTITITNTSTNTDTKVTESAVSDDKYYAVELGVNSLSNIATAITAANGGTHITSKLKVNASTGSIVIGDTSSNNNKYLELYCGSGISSTSNYSRKLGIDENGRLLFNDATYTGKIMYKSTISRNVTFNTAGADTGYWYHIGRVKSSHNEITEVGISLHNDANSRNIRNSIVVCLGDNAGWTNDPFYVKMGSWSNSTGITKVAVARCGDKTTELFVYLNTPSTEFIDNSLTNNNHNIIDITFDPLLFSPTSPTNITTDYPKLAQYETGQTNIKDSTNGFIYDGTVNSTTYSWSVNELSVTWATGIRICGLMQKSRYMYILHNTSSNAYYPLLWTNNTTTNVGAFEVYRTFDSDKLLKFNPSSGALKTKSIITSALTISGGSANSLLAGDGSSVALTNLWWANVNISKTSSTSTTPKFGKVSISDCDLEYDSTDKCLKFKFN